MTRATRPPFASLFAIILVFLLGCAPKVIRVYEPEPSLQAKENLVEYAITHLGKPYRNGAKGPQAFDCSGFVYYVYGRYAVAMPVSTDGLAGVGYEVSRREMTAGDLAVFRINRDMHVGIMINPLEFIHASSSRGVAIDSLDLPYWQRSFSHFRRVF